MDFNQQPLKIARFLNVKLKVGKQETKRARSLLAATERSLVGHDWLATLHYQFKPSNQIEASEFISLVSGHLINGGHSSEVNSINRHEVISAFPRLLTGQKSHWLHDKVQIQT